MRTDEIRRTFLDFFAERGHQVWPSASLIPQDPSLLLTIAGMVPFKDYLSGDAAADNPRAASVQKCARTNDIENVGVTTRHFTVFEMLGNWSFGDYFKREAIAWAWELSTRDFGFDPERIWATVYLDDDESVDLWLAETDVPLERIQRLDASENWWDMGAAGPCGPSSELHYDRGPAFGDEGGPAANDERYLEFWNLVFMQYERDDAGNLLGALPKPCVDTGMGLERMSMLCQGVPNAFEIDVVRPLLDRASELTGVAYGDDPAHDVSLRVIAEHARSAAFLIGDGVLPSNEARGYVLRRLLRRAVRHTRLLGSTTAVMPTMVATAIDTLGQAYPELRAQSQLITRIAASEEERFATTLRSGLAMLDDAIGQAKADGVLAIPARTAFALHDTYGFPVELTLEIAAEADLDLDRDAFAAQMQEQRDRARAAAKGAVAGGTPTEHYRQAAAATGPTTFRGYTDDHGESALGALVTPGGLTEVAEEGQEVEVVLATTPFYAEAGGQLGDHGTIRTDTGRLAVTDTTSPFAGLTVHRATVVAGEVQAGQDAHAQIDTARRAAIARGHTGTHILHAALKELLGEHATQAGSAIDAGRFRFDFPHFSPVSGGQLGELEHVVNDRIAADDEITTVETTQDEARKMGATALFGEKYGERVRVVRIGDYSLEFCGGTHVGHTAQVGLFSVLSEGSIAANLRRVEAITGTDALAYLSRERLVAQEVAKVLKVGTDEVVARVGDLVERLRGVEKDLARSREQALLALGDTLLADAEAVGRARLVAAVVADADRDGLKTLALDLRNRLDGAAVLLGAPTPDGKALLVAAVDPALGVDAAAILRPGAQVVGGGAGGRGDVAQAGGRDGTKIADALEASRITARELLRA